MTSNLEVTNAGVDKHWNQKYTYISKDEDKIIYALDKT